MRGPLDEGLGPGACSRTKQLRLLTSDGLQRTVDLEEAGVVRKLITHQVCLLSYEKELELHYTRGNLQVACSQASTAGALH